MENYNQEIKKASEKLLENTEEYIRDKRKNFETSLILISTVLGFSVGLGQGVEVNSFLVISWLFQITFIFLGVSYLILELESRYSRTLVQQLKYMVLLKDAVNTGK